MELSFSFHGSPKGIRSRAIASPRFRLDGTQVGVWYRHGVRRGKRGLCSLAKRGTSLIGTKTYYHGHLSGTCKMHDNTAVHRSACYLGYIQRTIYLPSVSYQHFK